MMMHFGQSTGKIDISIPMVEQISEEQKSITDFGNEGLVCPHCGGSAKRMGNCSMYCTSCNQTTRGGCGEKV